MAKKFTDPADEGKDKNEIDAEMAQLDPSSLSRDEVGSIPPSIARGPHPFEGYPLKRKVKIGKANVSATYIVLLKDPDVFQDESGKSVTHEYFEKDKQGKDVQYEDADGKLKKPKVKRRALVDLKTFHSRVTVHPVTGDNIDTVFDREVAVGDDPWVCAIVPSHAARASICMYLEKDGAVRVDKRYALADTDQIGRLRRVFDQVNYQQLKAERMAQSFDNEPSSGPNDRRT